MPLSRALGAWAMIAAVVLGREAFTSYRIQIVEPFKGYSITAGLSGWDLKAMKAEEKRLHASIRKLGPSVRPLLDHYLKAEHPFHGLESLLQPESRKAANAVGLRLSAEFGLPDHELFMNLNTVAEVPKGKPAAVWEKVVYDLILSQAFGADAPARLKLTAKDSVVTPEDLEGRLASLEGSLGGRVDLGNLRQAVALKGLLDGAAANPAVFVRERIRAWIWAAVLAQRPFPAELYDFLRKQPNTKDSECGWVVELMAAVTSPALWSRLKSDLLVVYPASNTSAAVCRQWFDSVDGVYSDRGQ